MPDVTVAVVVIDARDHVLHGIDLIGPQDHELLRAADETVFDGLFPDDGTGEVRRIVVGEF